MSVCVCCARRGSSSRCNCQEPECQECGLCGSHCMCLRSALQTVANRIREGVESHDDPPGHESTADEPRSRR